MVNGMVNFNGKPKLIRPNSERDYLQVKMVPL